MTTNPLDDVVPFQIGYLTTDLESAISTHRHSDTNMSWSYTGWLSGVYYDGTTAQVLRPRVRMAIGLWTSNICIEYIQPDTATRLPWAWDAKREGVSTHRGYWTSDIIGFARYLLAHDYRLVTVKLLEDTADKVAQGLRDNDWPDWLPVVYLQHQSGMLVELVATQLWPERFIAQFGTNIVNSVPAPANAK